MEKYNKEDLNKEKAPSFDSKTLDIDKLSEEKEKLVIAKIKVGKRTKVAFQSLDESKKNNMFNMFCVTWNEPSESGDYICKIDGFRKDKNGGIYAIVSPVIKLESLHYQGNCWKLIISSGSFWSPYNAERPVQHGKYNPEILFAKLNIENNSEAAKLVVEKLIDGETSLDEINKFLNKSNEFEKAAYILQKKYRNHTMDNLPLVQSRISRENMDVEKMSEFLKVEHEAYNRLGFSGAISYMEEAEQVLQHYADKKEFDKNLRKEKRKSK